MLPISIIIASLLVAGAVILTSNNSPKNTASADTQSSVEFKVPGEDDHIRGNINAQITVVEYSDFNCTFCARLHPTLSKIIEDSGGEVNWAYRHFANYSKGRVAAIGSECVAKLSGNNAFWEFSDVMFNNQKSLGDKFSIETAVSLGVNKADFQSCLDNSREIEEKIASDRNEALSLGGRGTPFAVIITPKRQLIPFSGALPYEQISALIEQAKVN